MKQRTQPMKRLLCFVLALVMVFSIMPQISLHAQAAAPKVLYLKPNSNWKQNDARFAAYFFTNGDGSEWVNMTDSDGDGIYAVAVPTDKNYSNVIFCRMNPGDNTNDWNNRWNQTGDLTVPTKGNNFFTVPNGAWSGSTTGWSTLSFKVTFNGTGVTMTGADSVTAGYAYTATLTAADGYALPETITVTGASKHSYNPTTGELSIAAGNITGDLTITAQAVRATYSVTFNGTNVTMAGATSVTAGNAYTATLTAEEGYTLPETITVNGAKNYSYDQATGKLSIAAGNITGDLTITAQAVRATYSVTFNGTNVTMEGATSVTAGNEYRATLKAAEGYVLPDGITVTGATEYSYKKETGELSIAAGNITGNLTITAVGVEIPAEPEPDPVPATITVYFRNDWCWSDVSVYYWGSAGTNPPWPGYPMTVVEKVDGYDVYSAQIPADATGITFSGIKDDGSNTRDQSPDIIDFDDGDAFYMHGDGENKCSKFDYTPPSGEEGGEGEETEKRTYTVIFHFANTVGWSPVNLYVWNDDGASTGSWPGTAMTSRDENGYYTMTVSYEAATNNGLNYILNNGSVKTGDLKLADSYFDPKTNTAEVWLELNENYEIEQLEKEPLSDVKLAVSPRISGTSVTFEYVDDSASSVEVRGTLTATPWGSGIAMKKNDKGIWTVTVDNLAPAVYEYKFVVNGETWVADPANGNVNSKGNSTFTIQSPEAVDNNKVEIHIYYNRADGIYTQENADGTATGVWNAYVWGDSVPGTRYDFAPEKNDLNGDGKTDQMVTTITVIGRDTGYVALKTRMSTEAKDWLREESEVKVNLGNIVSGTIYVYVNSEGQNGKAGALTSSEVIGTDIVTANKVTDVSYDYEKGTVIVTMLEVLEDAGKLAVIDTTGDRDTNLVKSVSTSGKIYTLTLNKTPSLQKLSNFKVKYDGYTYDITLDDVYASNRFAEEYTYTGTDLGANWSQGSTTFKVWAPTASAVSVKLYTSGTKGTDDLIETVAMAGGTEKEKGVWTVTVDGDLNGTYYTYAVTVDSETIEAVDPYARTTGVNGNRGMVIDLDSTDPDDWAQDKNPNPVTSQTDAVIYELHVRDFSIDDSSGVKNEWQGKYLAFTRTGTTIPGTTTSTGIDYLADLGITHLHLLPVYDYGSVDETTSNTFNWGYDPQNYNVPEGSYSTDPYDGAVRVEEFKQMVQSLHNKGISVVMDVVYNHVYNADKFCFNNIVPGYFSRPDSNTSGCGNDTASEREMVRKYIVESVMYWHQEYHIDGFRFDLVGLLDVETINQIVETVHACCPDVIFYGEGWDMDSTNKEPGTEMAKQGNASKTPGFAYFSDSMRNNLGGNNGHSTGFVSGAGNGGSMVSEWMANPWWTTNPGQVVQYASCHDNYTLADKLILSTGASVVTSNIIKMNNLAAAFYMTAQGVPFIHAHEEVLREKLDENGKRAENSYNASDYVNHLDWTDLEKYADNVAYYKGLIAFRQANPALRYATAAEVSANVHNLTAESNLLVFRVDANGTADTEDEDILIIFNAGKDARTVVLPEGEWTIYVNGKQAGTTALGTANGSVSVAGISAMVLTTPDEGKDGTGPSAEKTIYFTNNKGWDKVYAYAWDEDGKWPLGAWPGTEATFYKTNDYGQPVYQITLPASATGIAGLIFSDDGGEQTVDIVPGPDGIGYYPQGDKNPDGKYPVGSWTERAPAMGDADEYFLIGYINSVDYTGNAYKFDAGTITVNFTADSYVYVVNGTGSETYMTDGYLGAVSSATLKNTRKYTSSQWDKMLIPGGAEVTITMVRKNDNTITLSYETTATAFEDKSGIQDGVTLHAWNWSFDNITANMAKIAAQGYTAVQTSPIQPLKEATNGAENTVGSHWWVYYQPVDFVITTDEGNALGTKTDFAEMCAEAEKYGIKIIVDVVANHLANEKGNDLSPKIPAEIRENEDYWHNYKVNITDHGDRGNMTQNSMGGLPDLNTANGKIQAMVLAFLKECVDAGADGFRFDAAKHIETPDDAADIRSDFWPNVVGGIQEYADGDLYIYGETLDNWNGLPVSAYTKYMSITDNVWGNTLREAISVSKAEIRNYYKPANASNLVIWAESHDTYANAKGGSADETTDEINKTWAIVAARADAMGLYLARPEAMDQAIGVASVTGWAEWEVKAVNDFHNAFVGKSETVGSSGELVYVVRDDSGIVIVNVDDTYNVNLTVPMDDGTYTDLVSGNTFKVTNGTITGEIGESGIAVVYNHAHTDTFGDDHKCDICEKVLTGCNDGNNDHKCDICGGLLTNCGDATVVVGKPASCTSDGWKEHYKCSCGSLYEDKACTKPIADLESWKTGEGKIPAAHELNQKNAQAPTCDNAGWEAYEYCSNCDYSTYVEIPELGHDMRLSEEQTDPTCKEPGKTAVYTCANNCGKSEGGKEIPATGDHDFHDGICENCGESDPDYQAPVDPSEPEESEPTTPSEPEEEAPSKPQRPTIPNIQNLVNKIKDWISDIFRPIVPEAPTEPSKPSEPSEPEEEEPSEPSVPETEPTVPETPAPPAAPNLNKLFNALRGWIEVIFDSVF